MKRKTCIPKNKIKVFISSICGQPKYDKIREELKILIESTNFADVYLFEAEGASTASAGVHYVFSLEDCDVCIFLIDNKDGITPGVQKEIDTVKKRKIKALYYFCSESSSEETALQKSLKGASFAKSKTVNSFDELSLRGAQDLVNDIVFIYHHYCKKRLIVDTEGNSEATTDLTNIQLIKDSDCDIPKVVLEQIDKCSDYILEFATGEKVFRMQDEKLRSSELDEWGLKFLYVLFGEKSIVDFNTSMMLSYLSNQHSTQYHSIVKIRWKAIQAYFGGNLSACLIYLEQALSMVKEGNFPEWIIQDILIDLRNMQVECSNENNKFSVPDAQAELDKLDKNVFYPIIDRISNSLKGDYVQGLYKKEIQSPHTVMLGCNFITYGKSLASIYMVALYNGSLTHILSIFERIKDFSFYLSKRYGDWNYVFSLFKLAVFTGSHSEIDGLQRAHSKLLSNLSSDDAEELVDFCSNYPIKYKCIIKKMRAFGAVGYYLSDDAYCKYEKDFITMVDEWFDNEKSVVWIGETIIKTLEDVLHRMNQDIIARICCKFFDRHYLRWYMDLFKLFSKRIDIAKMSKSVAESLIEHIKSIIENDNERDQIMHYPTFLSKFRKQSKELTNSLNIAIAKYFPDYYNNGYLVETTSTPSETYPEYINNYINMQRKDNCEQGKKGVFFESGIRKLSVLKNILNLYKVSYSIPLMKSIIETAVDTILNQNTSLYIKEDAIALLCCIAINYSNDFIRNRKMLQRIEDNKEKALEVHIFPMSGNLDITALQIGYSFLLLTMGKEIYSDLIEFLPYVKNSTATLIHVSGFIAELIEYKECNILSNREEAVLLFNASDWLHSENTDVRWNSMRILFSLLRNPEHREIINRIIVDVIESENVYIKNLILTQLSQQEGISKETREFVFEICEKDANYVTRKRCQEVKSECSFD